MASPYRPYSDILKDILKELQKRKRRKNPPNPFRYRIEFRSDRRLLGVAYGLLAVTIVVYFWNSDANCEVIIGHYILSTALTIWSIWGYLYSKGTWIDVIDDGEREDSRMIIRNPFEGERIFMMSEIGEVKLEKDTAMYIYDADGNLVISISDTADNFDLLAQNLEWHNKKIKEVSSLEMLKESLHDLIGELRKPRC